MPRSGRRHFQPVTSAAMQAALRKVAERHGYVATRGPRPGQGSPSELIQALDDGELATVLLDPDDRAWLVAWLREQAEAMGSDERMAALYAPILRSVAEQLSPSDEE